LAHDQNSSEGQSRYQTSPKDQQTHFAGLRINFCEPSALLIVDEDIELAISKQKLKIVLLALNAKLASSLMFL